MKNIIFVLIIIFSITLSSQKTAEKDIESPIEFPILLSGNFGELRSSGFHSGIDIKTKGKEGVLIRSIDSGYVSRVQVSTSGFGKVIYINHANNLTSVYAHLSRFSDKIEKIINQLQYKNKSYEIRKFFKKDELKISKKEILGFSGNTGTSFGPHLHFEIRKTDTELPINPRSYKFKIKDTIRPYVNSLYMYGIKNGLLKKVKLDIEKINDSTYRSNTIKTRDTIGFGVISYDRQNLTNNIFGNYKYSLFKNDSLDFEFTFDSFSFPEKPIQKEFVDYEFFVLNKSRIVKLFSNKEKKLRFVSKNSNGIIINENEKVDIKIKLSDYDKNNTYLVIPLIGSENNYEYDNEVFFPNNKIIDPEKGYELEFNGHKLSIDKNTFQRKSKILFEYENDTLYAYNPFIEAMKNFEINFLIDQDSIGQYLSRKNYDGSSSFVSNKITNGYYKFKTKSLGKFYIDYDTILPSIIRNKRINYKKQIQYFIRDKETGIKSYVGKINNKWALFEYEPKLNKIFFKNDTLIKKNQINRVEIEIQDLVGNSKVVIDSLQF